MTCRLYPCAFSRVQALLRVVTVYCAEIQFGRNSFAWVALAFDYYLCVFVCMRNISLQDTYIQQQQHRQINLMVRVPISQPFLFSLFPRIPCQFLFIYVWIELKK